MTTAVPTKPMAPGDEEPRPAHRIEDFLDEPTRSLEDWRWLWREDRPFPIRSHRGAVGKLLVLARRLLRPLVRSPQADLWDRQRVFNLILLEYLQQGEQRDALLDEHRRRLERLEAFMREGLEEVMRHNDSLFARVDLKLDRYRREARELLGTLGAALARAEESGGTAVAPLLKAREELEYRDLEDRFRGTEDDIRSRLERYLPIVEGRGEVLDLGCGRGEALEVFGAAGIPARGVDASAEMVAQCHQKGLEAEEGDLFEYLRAVPPGSLGAVVSFHVIEHLPPGSLSHLARLAWGALAEDGVLILETPNPMSVVVAARNFWLDPTHRRPIHPIYLHLVFLQAGFEPVERIVMRPFPEEERLPEITLDGLAPEVRELADRLNRLRDRLDQLLFGYQDYAVIGYR